MGLDLSPGMLDAARQKVAGLTKDEGSLLLLEGDMRELALDRAFNLVIIPFNGFLSLLSVDDQVRTLSRVRDHLAPGGRLIFDIFVPDADMLVQEGGPPVPPPGRDPARHGRAPGALAPEQVRPP